MAEEPAKPKQGFSDIKEDKPEAKAPAKAKPSGSMPYTIGGLVVACWAALLITGSASLLTVIGMGVITLAAAAVIYKHFNP